MAEIVCIECKSSVSDALAFCSECGFPFPFNGTIAEQQEIGVAGDAVEVDAAANKDVAHITTTIPSSDMLQQTFDSLVTEMGELKRTITEIRQSFNSNSTISAENVQNALSAITLKLDELIQFNREKEAEAQAIAAKEANKGLLATFYKSLNSPSSMLDYMFYISVVQIIFVVVNLFLVAYIVTLVRE